MGGYSLTILVPIILFVVGMAAYVIYTKFYKKSKGQGQPGKNGEQKPGGQPVMCRVADNMTLTIYTALVPWEDIKKTLAKHKTLGRRWDRYGTQVYGLCRRLTGSYEPIVVTQKPGQAPSELHEDMQQPEVPVLFDMREEKGIFEKYGKILWWVAIMALIMYFYIESI